MNTMSIKACKEVICFLGRDKKIMKRKRLYIACFMLWGLFLQASGQTATALKKDSTTAASSSSFNALQYSLQKRYRPKGYIFENKRFADNAYISLSAGYERFYLRDFDKYNSGPVFGLALGKAVSKSNSFRLALIGNVMTSKAYTDNKKMIIAGLQVDHLFNFSSYVSGYNPSRLFEISSVEGLGYHLSMLDGESMHAADLHLGIQLKLHSASRVDITVEPRVTLYSSNIDHSEKGNWHKYNMGYGVWAGFNYHFSLQGMQDGGRFAYHENSFLDNFFISASAGGVMPASRTRLEVMDAVGGQYVISVGKWFMPVFGLRLSGFWASDKWGANYADPSVTYSNEMFGGRFEGMINFLTLFSPKMVDSVWELNTLLGVEAGQLRKELDLEQKQTKTVYAGFTGGLQVKFKFLKHYGIFIEPRFSQVPYKLDILQDDGISYRSFSYTDRQISLNAGLQYTF